MVLPISPTTKATIIPTSARDGLVGHWRFDEGSGSTAQDSSIKDNDGAITGATYITGKIGSNALSFDGVGDNVKITDFPGLSTDNSFSISLWANIINIPSSPRESNIIGFRPVPVRGIGIDVIHTTGIVKFKMRDDSESSTINLATNPSGFHHYVITYDSDTSTMEGFFDGTSQGDTTHTNVELTTDHEIGGNNVITGSSAYFKGEIDDVRIFNKVISQAEIDALKALGD